MQTIPWDYQLSTMRQTSNGDYFEQHHFATLQDAMWTLMAHHVADADHHGLAFSDKRQPIAFIDARENTDLVLLELWVEPLRIEGLATAQPGLYIHTPAGTIHDFEEMLGQDLFRFSGYDGDKKVLHLAGYQNASELVVTLDPAFLPLERALAADIVDDGKYVLTISEPDLIGQHRTPRHYLNAFYFQDPVDAFTALFNHHYIQGKDAAPFLPSNTAAQLKILDPDDKTIAATRVVTAENSDAGNYPQPGLFLLFPGGIAATSAEHRLPIKLPKDPSLEDEYLIIADFSRDYHELMLTPVFDLVKQQIEQKHLPVDAARREGYELALSYLPTRIPVEVASAETIEINRLPFDRFDEAMTYIKDIAFDSLDRTQAVVSMSPHYLMEAVLRRGDTDLARVFYQPAGDPKLAAGKYLTVHTENMDAGELAVLKPIFSQQPHQGNTHPIKGQTYQAPLRKRHDNGRTLPGGGGPGRGI